MNTEEKAKRYDEALEVCKKLYNEAKANEYTSDMEDYESIFPELAESEDEKIRKELIEYFSQFDNGELRGVDITPWIAWLEKQGEKKSIDNLTPQEAMDIAVAKCFEEGEQKPVDIKPIFEVGDEIIRSSKNSCPVHSSTDDTICKVAEIHDTCYILDTKEGKIQTPFEWQDYYELVEQKPAWSEEDKNLMYDTIGNLTELKNRYGEEYGNVGKCIDWLKSLKDRVQPKQEWSEEDENRFNNLIFLVECSDENEPTKKGFIDFINRLKSASHQGHWKPSDEQITALANAKEELGFDYNALQSLCNDLLKLKEL